MLYASYLSIVDLELFCYLDSLNIRHQIGLKQNLELLNKYERLFVDSLVTYSIFNNKSAKTTEVQSDLEKKYFNKRKKDVAITSSHLENSFTSISQIYNPIILNRPFLPLASCVDANLEKVKNTNQIIECWRLYMTMIPVIISCEYRFVTNLACLNSKNEEILIQKILKLNPETDSLNQTEMRRLKEEWGEKFIKGVSREEILSNRNTTNLKRFPNLNKQNENNLKIRPTVLIPQSVENDYRISTGPKVLPRNPSNFSVSEENSTPLPAVPPRNSNPISNRKLPPLPTPTRNAPPPLPTRNYTQSASSQKPSIPTRNSSSIGPVKPRSAPPPLPPNRSQPNPPIGQSPPRVLSRAPMFSNSGRSNNTTPIDEYAAPIVDRSTKPNRISKERNSSNMPINFDLHQPNTPTPNSNSQNSQPTIPPSRITSMTRNLPPIPSRRAPDVCPVQSLPPRPSLNATPERQQEMSKKESFNDDTVTVSTDSEYRMFGHLYDPDV